MSSPAPDYRLKPSTRDRVELGLGWMMATREDEVMVEIGSPQTICLPFFRPRDREAFGLSTDPRGRWTTEDLAGKVAV